MAEKTRIYIDLQSFENRRGDTEYFGEKNGIGYVVKRPSLKWEDAGTKNWIFIYKDKDMYAKASKGENIKVGDEWKFPTNDAMIWLKEKTFTDKNTGGEYTIVSGYYADDDAKKGYRVSFGKNKAGDKYQIVMNEADEYRPSTYKKENTDDGSLPF